jgi:hypothetical protein
VCASVLGVVVLLGTLPGAAVAAKTPAAVTSGPSDASLFVPDRSLYQADQIAKARGGFGAYRDRTSRQIVVLAQKTAAVSFATADIASVGAPVDVRTSKFDSTSVRAMESEVEGLYTRLTGNQTIVSGYDIQHDMFTIRSNAPESAFAEFEAKYPGKVAYTFGDLALTNRHDDGPPHWGGAELDMNGSPWCTSGYTIHIGSYNYMVTAGHCFSSIGATVWGGTGVYWGTIQGRTGYPNTDAELIGGGSYEGVIYNSYSGSERVKGYTNGSPGSYPYCVSGNTNGTHCDYSEDRDNLTITFSNGNTTSGLVELIGTGVKGGDSGGPAYAENGGNAFIFGSVVGAPQTCSPLPSSCLVFIEPWSRVQSVYGGYLVTG